MIVVLVSLGIDSNAQTTYYENVVFENGKLKNYVQRINGTCIGNRGYQWFAYLYIVNKTNDEMRVNIKFQDVYKSGDYDERQTRRIQKNETVILKRKESKSFPTFSESSKTAACQEHNFIEKVELINYAINRKSYETKW